MYYVYCVLCIAYWYCVLCVPRELYCLLCTVYCVLHVRVISYGYNLPPPPQKSIEILPCFCRLFDSNLSFKTGLTKGCFYKCIVGGFFFNHCQYWYIFRAFFLNLINDYIENTSNIWFPFIKKIFH